MDIKLKDLLKLFSDKLTIVVNLTSYYEDGKYLSQGYPLEILEHYANTNILESVATCVFKDRSGASDFIIAIF